MTCMAYFVPAALQVVLARAPVTTDLFVPTAGYFAHWPGHLTIRAKGIREHIFIHCIAGRGWLELAGKRWGIGAGQALVVPAGHAHAYGADERTPWEIRWVHFAGRRSGEYLKMLGVTSESPVFQAPDSSDLMESFSLLSETLSFDHTVADLTVVAAEFARYLALVRRHRADSGARGKRVSQCIHQSIAQMREQLAARHTLHSLARRAELSVSHYRYSFKQVTGQPPLRYLLNLRVAQACFLFSSTGLSVAEVARNVGFDNQFYFSRQFKNTLGVTPSAYKKTPKG